MSDVPPEVGAPVCYRHPDRESHIRCQRCSRPICPDCMRDAAVGFQCPSCIAEGRKTTRQATAPYGGARSSNPALTSLVIIGVNVAVWVAVLANGGASGHLVDLLGLRPNGLCDVGNGGFELSRGVCESSGGTYLTGVSDGAYWQLVTSAFLQVQVWHIGGNMISLYVLGPQLESVLGRTRFLSLYLVSGLAGSAAVYWASYEYGLTLGASGAIFGLFGGLAVIVHKIGGDLRSIAGLLAVNIFLTFAIPNVSWQGHLGGFLGGLAVTGILVYAPRPRRAQVQALGLGAILALLTVAVVLRSVSLA